MKPDVKELAQMADYTPLGASFISHNVNDLNNPQIDKIRTLDGAVLCWTVRSPAQEKTARMRADNITFEGFLPSYKSPLHQSIAEIPASDWDACLRHGNSRVHTRVVDPFTTHRFLSALEISESVGAKTGWHPVHLVAWEENENEKKLIAIMPCYIKTHSQGEYIFDHDWAGGL